jgi:cytochrome c oxidase subunit III
MTTAARAEAQPGVPGALLGMIVFITSEIMFFGGLFAAYLSLRADSSTWPPDGIEVERAIPIALTAVLLTSSVTVHLAATAAKKGDRDAVRKALLLTVLLGLVFLGGQAFEYSRLGFGVDDGPYGSTFFATTGFHGIHVLIGVVILTLGTLQAGRRPMDVRTTGQIEAASYYWHFVDAIWILVFTTIYLIQ